MPTNALMENPAVVFGNKTFRIERKPATPNFMCRLLAYLGEPVQGDRLILQPAHSLEVQSYKPKEMTAGILNADGFGVGWYNSKKEDFPYTYKSLLPMWSDLNLPQISRYVESHCQLAYVRSATVGLPVDLGNCQPFVNKKLMFIHYGFIADFRGTLYRPIRSQLSDELYQQVHGVTDSEHMFALILNHYQDCLKTAIIEALKQLTHWAKEYKTRFSANIILSDGEQLWATRYAYGAATPTLYYHQTKEGITLASEPLDEKIWHAFPEQSLIFIDKNRDQHIEAIAQ